MPSDTAGQMAEDAMEAVADREKDWSKTYDVNLFGQKYTVTMMVETRLLAVPFFDDVRLGTEMSMEMLANTEQVTEYAFDYSADERSLADDIRQQIAMAHGRRMSRLSYDEKGYTPF